MRIHRITKGTTRTMNHSRTRRLAALTATVLAAAVCLAACGSSSSTSSSASAAASVSSTSSARSGTFNRTKLEACLKAHGVTLPTRPAGSAPPAGAGRSGAAGPGFFGGGGGAGAPGRAGSRFANPKFRAAFEACGGAAFRGGALRRRFSFSHAAIDKFVACVKQHGYDLPAPNFSGTGPIFPAKIERSAKFQAASRACASDLRPQGAPGAGSSSSSSTSSA